MLINTIRGTKPDSSPDVSTDVTLFIIILFKCTCNNKTVNHKYHRFIRKYDIYENPLISQVNTSYYFNLSRFLLTKGINNPIYFSKIENTSANITKKSLNPQFFRNS